MADKFDPREMPWVAFPTRAIWDQRLTDGDRKTLGAVSMFDYLRQDGRGCFASQKTLAQVSELDRRSVRRSLKKLEGCGYIIRTARSDAKQGHVLRVIDGGIETGRSHDLASTDNRALSCHPTGRSPVLQQGTQERHEREHEREHERDSSVASAELIPFPSDSPSLDAQQVDEVQQVADHWNAVAVPAGCRSIRKISSKRRTACRARLKDEGLDALKEAIDRISRSKFLTGKSGDWTGADIDFLLRPDKLNRILEGAYDDRRSGPSSFLEHMLARKAQQ